MASIVIDQKAENIFHTPRCIFSHFPCAKFTVSLIKVNYIKLYAEYENSVSTKNKENERKLSPKQSA